jgi:putative membrane protein
MSDTGAPPSTSDRLAQQRTTLADDRTAMAADRTLMAWIRTALSMISFGFTIYKFFHGLTDEAAIRLRHPNGPRDLGLFLTTLGTASLLAGTIQYVQTLRHIYDPAPRLGFVFYTACAVLILGLVVLFGMVTRLGPF